MAQQAAVTKQNSIKTVWSSIFLTPQGPVVTATVYREDRTGKITRRNYSSKGLEVSESRRATTTSRIVALLEGVHKREVTA